MRNTLLRVLVSPCCHQTLRSYPEPGDSDLDVGSLICSQCYRTFPIVNGVPDLVVERNRILQSKSFAYQWKMRFAGKAEPGLVLWGKNVKGLPVKLKGPGSYYLDCGCGSAETLRRVALENPDWQAVGMDIAEVVFATKTRDRCISNLHYVRGDALDPPFRPGAFRYVLALGVLHHTGDTHRATLATLNLLQKAGWASLWFYPQLEDLRAANITTEYKRWRRYYLVRDRMFLGHSHQVPYSVLRVVCRLLSAAISPFGHLLDLPVEDVRIRRRSNQFLLFDNLAAHWQDRPPKKDILSWFHEAGVRKVMHSFERGGVYTCIKD